MKNPKEHIFESGDDSKIPKILSKIGTKEKMAAFLVLNGTRNTESSSWNGVRSPTKIVVLSSWRG